MLLVRAIHEKHYDNIKRRFSSMAFEESDDGVSVFSAECAIERSGSVCSYLNEFHVPIGITAIPAIYWAFDDTSLPAGASHKESVAPGDDPCHRLIVGLKNKACSNFFKKGGAGKNASFPSLRICDPFLGSRPLQEQDLT